MITIKNALISNSPINISPKGNYPKFRKSILFKHKNKATNSDITWNNLNITLINNSNKRTK